MGLFDWFTKLFLGEKDAHFFASEGAQKANAESFANAVAPLIGGKIGTKDGGDEYHITGRLGGMPARVVVNVAFGGAEFQLKPGVESLGFLLLMHDSKGRSAYAGDNGSDDWDDDDETKEFVSEYLYFSGDAEELPERQRIWRSLPVELQQELIRVLERDKGTFTTSSNSIELKPWEGLLGRGEAAKIAEEYIGLLGRLGAVFGGSRPG